MNAFPPPSTPPAATPDSPPATTRRRGLIVGALVGVGALIAGGVVVAVALAGDDGDSVAAEADLAAQTEAGGLDAVFDAMGPFVICLGDDLDGSEIPENPGDLELSEIPAIFEEMMTAFEACSDLLPTEFPEIVPGAELLDDLADLDLADIPGLDDLWGELGEVLGLPALDDVEAQLDETLGQLPAWEEMQDEFEQHRRELEEKFDEFDLDEFDLGADALPWLWDLLPDDLRQDLDELKDQLGERENELEDGVEEPENELEAELQEPENELEEIEEHLDDFEIHELPIFEELFEDFDPEALPGLDEIFGQLDEEFGDLDLETLFEDLLGGSPTGGDGS